MTRKQATIETTAISRPRAPDLIPGYRLEKLVGKGGMGEVHKAIQLSLGRTVAVKLLAADLAKDPSFVTRFEKEAAALATLSHPNIVSIVEKGMSDGTYYLVMEFVDGPSLREVMRSPLLDSTSALRMAMEICRAIDYAHGRGVIHRDLKPENILFDEQAGGLAKVSDFGLAAFADNDSAPSKFNVTETHVSMGTLSYMAPEQRVDAKTADHRADVYSLGVILYELLVGEVPIGNFDPPSERKPGLDRRLDAIVARCLKPLPQDRYQKVAELIADLEPMVPVTFSQTPRRLGRVELATLKVKRAVARAVRVAAVVLVLAAATIVGLSLYRGKARTGLKAAPAEALTSATTPQSVVTVPARLDDGNGQRTLALFEGPDKVPFVSRGRTLAADAKGKTLSFAPVEDDAVAGHAYPDVDPEGDALTIEAEVVTSAAPTGLLASLQNLFAGPPPEARSALVFMGEPGRYAAVIVSGNGSPTTLEWALGDRKRGTTLGATGPKDGVPTKVELSVDTQGELRAFVGSGKDRRQIGEPVSLGSNWKTHFARAPRPALGCVEGTCQFKQVRLAVARTPAPVPAVATTPTPSNVKPAVAQRPTPTAVKKVSAPVRKTARSTPPTKKSSTRRR